MKHNLPCASDAGMSPDGFPEIPGVTTPGKEYASGRSAERRTQCQPRTRSRARARFSGCHTTGGGAASERGFVSAIGTRLSRACSRRGRSAGDTPLTSRDCFGAVRRAKLVGGRTQAAVSPGPVRGNVPDDGSSCRRAQACGNCRYRGSRPRLPIMTANSEELRLGECAGMSPER